MTPQEEAAYDVRVEKMLAGQRELPKGRDFRCFKHRFLDKQTDEFNKRWDQTFRCSPGSKEWLDRKYGKNDVNHDWQPPPEGMFATGLVCSKCNVVSDEPGAKMSCEANIEQGNRFLYFYH